MRRGPYVAKAVRLAGSIAERLRAGRVRPGTWLPSELDLSREHGCARATIRRVLALLEADRLVRRVPRQGVVVTGAGIGVVPPARTRARVRPLVAAICGAEPDEALGEALAGIAEGARAHGLEVHRITGDGDGALAALDRAEDLGIHGAIILPHPGDERRAALERLRTRGFPVVCVERRSADLRVPSVEADSRGGMYQATRHLLALHRRPVWWLGMTPAHRVDRDRHEGWRRAMVDAGYGGEIAARTVLHPWRSDDPRYWHVDEPWRQGLEIARELLGRGGRFWSIACQKDDIAWGLYHACAERGLTVGRHVAVVGFDDLSIAARLDPPLTTVRQPWREKGAKAAWLLARALHAGAHDPVEIVLPVELVVRASCGARSATMRPASPPSDAHPAGRAAGRQRGHRRPRG